MPETRPDGPRDEYAGPEAGPEPPFPIKLRGPVVKGFGRGSRELGIPTANIPPTGLADFPDLKSGVYFGFVGLKITPETTQAADNSKLTLSAPATASSAGADGGGSGGEHGADGDGIGVYPAVLSIGYNPFYSNPTRSIEIHILHPFPHFNFYHSALNLLILGFIRPEYDYKSLDDLVTDIRVDCGVAARSLRREGYERWKEQEKGGEWLREFSWVGDVDVQKVEGELLKGDKPDKVEGQGEGGKL